LYANALADQQWAVNKGKQMVCFWEGKVDVIFNPKSLMAKLNNSQTPEGFCILFVPLTNLCQLFKKNNILINMCL